MATVWALVSIPATVTLICVVVEVAHLWLARLELQQGLEAAALAGVKAWADASTANNHATPGALAITHKGRVAAQAAASVNTVSSQPIMLNLNEQNDGNSQTGFDNASCVGDILLGGFPNNGSTIFFTTAAVGCGRTTTTTTTFNVTFDMLFDTGAGDTSSIGNAFQISYSTLQPGISMAQMTMDLRHTPGALGNFQSGAAFPGGSEAAGAGPTVDPSSDVASAQTSFTLNGANTVLTANFTSGAWNSGQTLIYGVDTDRVRVDGSAPTVTDRGGNFGQPGASNGTPADQVLFSFAFHTPAGTTNLAPLDVTLQRLGNTRARLQGKAQQFNFTVTVVVPDVDFGVLAQKTVNVTPICTQIFGVPLGSMPISGRAIATSRCVGGNSFLVQNPQGVFFTGVTCP